MNPYSFNLLISLSRETADSLSYYSFKTCHAHYENAAAPNQPDPLAEGGVGRRFIDRISPLKYGLRLARFNVDTQAVQYVEALAESVKANPEASHLQAQKRERWRWWRNLIGYVIVATLAHIVLNRK
jgi:hypothetical protein